MESRIVYNLYEVFPEVASVKTILETIFSTYIGTKLQRSKDHTEEKISDGH